MDISSISDSELGMLELLTYLDNNVAKAAGLSGFRIKDTKRGLTIEQILKCFDEDALIALEQHTGEIDGACISGPEWAGIIRYLQGSDLRNLTLSSTMQSSDGNTTLALCFTQKGNTGQAIVAFKGTSGSVEWSDNAVGMNVTETPCQIEALDYIESLPYSSITVTGHSKGSNKAMYVTILSDKVDRCVGYDGQGFSREFIDKYWAEIAINGNSIYNYSVSTDYIHVLLYPVPNSHQRFCEGFGIDNAKQHHSPNSMFKTDKNRRLILDETGVPIINDEIPENATVTMLREFIYFTLNNADATEKTMIVNYVAPLLGMLFNKEISNEERLEFVVSDPEAVALMLTYYAKFVEVTDYSSEDLVTLLFVILGNEIVDFWGIEEISPSETLRKVINARGDPIKTVSALRKELAVGAKILLTGAAAEALPPLIDWLVEHRINDKTVWLAVLGLVLPNGIDPLYVWNKIEAADWKASLNGCESATNRTGEIRDFSRNVYDALMGAIAQMEDAGTASVAAWNSYSGESWFTALLVGLASRGVNEYFSEVTKINQKCKTDIDSIFDTVEQIDSNTAATITNLCNEIQGIQIAMSGIAGGIG